MQKSKRLYKFKCNSPGNSFAYMFFLVEQDGSRVGKFAIRFDKENTADAEFILEIERREHASSLIVGCPEAAANLGLRPRIELVRSIMVPMEEPSIELVQDLRACSIDRGIIEMVKTRVGR